jgi:glycosyltransferase involved in cell wall biosynthesis
MTSSADRTARQADARLAHMREVCVRATRLLAPSSYLRDRFIAAGIPADRIALVDLGVERMSTAAIARTPSRVLRLGFLGTMMVSKAPDVLLEAFRRLPQGEATVDLIGAYSPYHGDNSYQATLAPLLTLPGVRTHGELTHQQVLHALGSIDVLVVPSRWPENSPFVIPEAFLAGIPVVASRIGGIPEAVQDGRNGLLFRAGDVGDLHRVLTRLLREPALLPSLRAGIPTVRSIEEDAAGTRAIYGQIIAGRNAHPSHQSPGPPRADPDT